MMRRGAAPGPSTRRSLWMALAVFGVFLACTVLGHQAVALAADGDPPKLVALTFDDGPSKYTMEVVSVLQQKQVPGTFFFSGSCAARYPGLVDRLRADGLEVESHGWSHRAFTSLSSAAIRSQIQRADAVLGPTLFVRPPYGARSTRVISVIHSTGYKMAVWSVDTLDWRYRNVASIMKYVKLQTKPGAVILMHDGGGNRSATVAALAPVIDWLQSQGYTLVRLDQLGAAARKGTIN
jgi:peptidoglycan/xylan/chitin deacetylase (PgdA/CDA1 family)